MKISEANVDLIQPGHDPIAIDAAIDAPLANVPLAIYIHLPWCVRKCPYCDFNSHAADTFDEIAYVDALEADLDAQLPDFWGRRPHAVFIGGGTPSRFSGNAIARILDLLRSRFVIAPNTEITLEANPGASDADAFAAYREAGVNRLSIGVQSFDDQRLAALGRIHRAADAIAAFAAARRAGFERINLDLMFALPARADEHPSAVQGLEHALADLDTAISLGPEHISWYQLTIEPNTLFGTRPPQRPDDDAAAAIYCAGRRRLADAGYTRYEVSAYARRGEACRHNLNYWRFGDYIGLGAGAHGKRSDPASDRIVRTRKSRVPNAYMADPARTLEHDIAASDRLFEALLNGLRLVDGIERGHLIARTGSSANDLDRMVAPLIDRDWLTWVDDLASTVSTSASGAVRSTSAPTEIWSGDASRTATESAQDSKTAALSAHARLRATSEAYDHLDQILGALIPGEPNRRHV
ncbi:MAG: radical SAM family heme chaperone HemW [Thioalkalivibrionaceae bacterium]